MASESADAEWVGRETALLDISTANPHMVTAETQQTTRAAEAAKAIMVKLHEQLPRLGAITFSLGYDDPDTGRIGLEKVELMKYTKDFDDWDAGGMLSVEEANEAYMIINAPPSDEIRALAVHAGIARPSSVADILLSLVVDVTAGTKADVHWKRDPDTGVRSAYACLGIVKGFDDGPESVAVLPEDSPMFWITFTRKEHESHVFNRRVLQSEVRTRPNTQKPHQ